MKARLLVAVLTLTAACGSKPRANAAPTKVALKAPSQPVLNRSKLNQALDAGLGAALQHVTLADLPVSRSGVVVGYQVLSLDDAEVWTLFDLRPGDVLVALNDGSLATPDAALASFEALRGAEEVRVRIERAGRSTELKQRVVSDK